MSNRAAARVQSDYKDIINNPAPGIYVQPSEENLFNCDALIIGPASTPYENGFFQFHVKFPIDYPIQPPKVMFLTHGSGKYRMNPNLYENGRVCLSILGTWFGPSWKPVLTLRTVLISIQSLLHELPYYNEPGYSKEPIEKAKAYNEWVCYHTLKVAVIDVINELLNPPSKNAHQPFKSIILETFSKNISSYEALIAAKKSDPQINGSSRTNHSGGQLVGLDYDQLSVKFEAVKQKWLARSASGDTSAAGSEGATGDDKDGNQGEGQEDGSQGSSSVQKFSFLGMAKFWRLWSRN